MTEARHDSSLTAGASVLSRPAAARVPTAPAVALNLIIGAMQGFVLWMLYEAVHRSIWPATSPRALGAAFYVSVAAPLAWYLGHSAFASERVRLAFTILLGAGFGVLGAHAGTIFKPGIPPPWLASYVVGAGVLGFVAVSLAGGWETGPRRFDYPRLFELAWRNAVLMAVVAALTGSFWVVLLAGAWLMESIGIKGLFNLYGKPAFAMPVTGAVVGLSFGLALVRAHMLIALRHFLLSLAMWFLPLTLLFAVAWVAALPFTGVQPLFRTGNAGFYLLWFGTLAIVFVNAAFQDGREPPGYPQWLAKSLAWAWLAMPLLALLAGWALWQRVAQHGWTPDRIWAAVVWTLVTVYAVGYAGSVLRRCAWMPTISATNVAAALVQVIVIVALISPIADVHRLTVTNQVARLRAGTVSPAAFDWNLLLRDTGRHGLAALKEIAASAGDDERSKLIATKAADILRLGSAPNQSQDSKIAMRALREHITVRPRGVLPDEALLEWLARPQADWAERKCLATPDACALWIIDLDHDSKPEAVLLWETGGTAEAWLYSQGPNGWHKEGPLHGTPRALSIWLSEIDAGRVALVPPRWPDLSVNGDRLRLGP